MMDDLDFSEQEIQEQLAILGYKNIPKHRLREFKKDLDELIEHGEWRSLVSPTDMNSTKSQRATTQPSPPAFTKEKVSQCYFENSGEGFFLHAGQADRGRQSKDLDLSSCLELEKEASNIPLSKVLVNCPNRDDGGLQGRCDSYAKHSVAPKLQLPPGAPSRLQVEPDPDDTLHPPLTDSCTSTPDTQGRRFIKRKVLRKHKGQSLVCDESVYSVESDADSCLEERLADLHLFPSARRDFDAENASDQSDTQSTETEGSSVSAFESYIRGVTRAQCDGDVRPKPKSFIRPPISQQAIKKTDPVNMYFKYKQFWEMFKLPGENDRRALRMEIKERLAYQPPPPKPRRVYVPNTYVVPTEKKRSALRWEIRNDLANGLMPCKFSYQF